MKFIELFSGIGAFTQAMDVIRPGSECVFAADNDPECVRVYKNNYGIDSYHDITKVNAENVPAHDFCFFSPPCQAFSKSGKQLGFEETRGTLIFDVFRILKRHHPKYILMENVRNLASHDNGRTFKVISDSLKEIGYRIPSKPIILSPHYFGIPQTRERVFLPGIYDGTGDEPLEIEFGKFMKKEDCRLEDIIDHSYDDDTSLCISKSEERVLSAWDDFYNGIKETTLGFPIWYDYFFDKNAEPTMPEWKKTFIAKNKALYLNNREFIDDWAERWDHLKGFTPTHKKFEWQAGSKIDSLWEGLIQIRPSGIRVKSLTTAPALVAIVQIQILGPEKRRLSVRECANLQSFPQSFKPAENVETAYRQLGNSINVKCLSEVVAKLLFIGECKDPAVSTEKRTAAQTIME